MQLSNQNNIPGLPEYLYHGQNERVDELNDRMISRQFPDSPLQPNFDPRPVPTKYAHFPIINRRTPLKEPVIPYLDYNQSINFNPGTQKAPPSGYFNNVDLENRLRNQYFALQHGAEQNVYVPSSTSDMYRVILPSGSQLDPQPFPDLFDRGQFEGNTSMASPSEYFIDSLSRIPGGNPTTNDPSPNPNVASTNIGKDTLYNHTRTQLRNGL